MGAKSKIGWTDASWNPVLGCSKVSSGCQLCYAVGHVHRLAGNPNPTIKAANEGLTRRHTNGQLDWSGVVRVIPARLTQPLRWKEPKLIFVNSLSDVFHEDLDFALIDEIFGVMAAAPQHTFQILTKRPERMVEYLTTGDPLETREEAIMLAAAHVSGLIWDGRGSDRSKYGGASRGITDKQLAKRRAWPGWPLPNVWIGTSVEDQAAADKRIPYLLKTPAAVRFLSCEPLLGPVDLCLTTPVTRVLTVLGSGSEHPEVGSYNALTGEWWPALGNAEDEDSRKLTGLPRLNWIIGGGESGAGARPWHPEWAYSLLNQCLASRVPFFWKQHGEWTPDLPHTENVRATALMHRNGRYFVTGQTDVVPKWVEERVGCGADPDVYMYRVGKHAAGRLLDSREWNEMPT